MANDIKQIYYLVAVECDLITTTLIKVVYLKQVFFPSKTQIKEEIGLNNFRILSVTQMTIEEYEQLNS